jgi:transposase
VHIETNIGVKIVHNSSPFLATQLCAAVTENGPLIWLFAGADTGAETLARAMTVVETAKLNGLDPQAYLADILDRIYDHKINRLDELLPWNWVPMATIYSKAA